MAEDYEIVAPEPGALIESLRAFGYTPQTAIADLIDNSITAGARNIWVYFTWNGDGSYITVRDDGKGMTSEELVAAMRAGSQNPRTRRGRKDLGRFGLGLKTASFSQCRILTVASKVSGSSITTRRWDLDYVGQTSEWRLLHETASGSEQRISGLKDQEKGTLVLWECMDRIVSDDRVDDQKAERRFLSHISNVEQHLGMVFHRFIDDLQGITIHINGHQISSWDPFLSSESTTQPLQEERLHLHDDVVRVRPYVLPHHSRLSAAAHDRGGGPRGWNTQQGFYIYRNRRLLLAGDWLGLGMRKEEHYKLARIAIDLPNSMDHEWDIDVRKSRARPPGILQEDLRRIARITRERAVDVYRHRGKVLSRKTSGNDIFIWNRELKSGRVKFRINREHPLIADLLQFSVQEDRKRVETLLRLIEETIPVPLITLENSEHPDKEFVPFEGSPPSEMLGILKEVYISLRRSGIPSDEAKERLIALEPFQEFNELVMALRDDEMMGEDL
ncbi:MAG: ATP-binding protein [Ktedonobacteraceae bacterium]|nr:ATP-binding protein [Ktedonobacteraceae bacterium]